MQRKGLGRHMWDMFSPLLISYSVSFLVEMIIIFIYGTQYLNGLTETIETQEQVYEHLMIIAEKLTPYTTQIGALAAVATIPFLMIMVRKDRLLEKAQGFIPNKTAPVSQYIYAAVMSVAFAIGLNNILLLLNISEYSEAYQESAELLYAPSFAVQILCLGIIYPIMEEYIFRGLIFRRMRTRTPAMIAILSSAGFFGIYHGNSVQFIYGTLCGIMLGYVYEKFGSLKAPIAAHICMNTVVVILTELNAFQWMFAVPIRMAIITVLCAAVGSSMFVVIQKIEEKPEKISEEMEQIHEN